MPVVEAVVGDALLGTECFLALVALGPGFNQGEHLLAAGGIRHRGRVLNTPKLGPGNAAGQDVLGRRDTIYNTIREIEATFRVLKTDLDLRPIYHKTDAAALAHLHLGLLAYWIVNTVRHQLKQKGNNSQWKDIVRTMNTQKMVTTTMDDQYDQRIEIRQCSEPIAEVEAIYTALGYRTKPFGRKKSVVPLTLTKKMEIPVNRAFSPP